MYIILNNHNLSLSLSLIHTNTHTHTHTLIHKSARTHMHVSMCVSKYMSGGQRTTSRTCFSPSLWALGSNLICHGIRFDGKHPIQLSCFPAPSPNIQYVNVSPVWSRRDAKSASHAFYDFFIFILCVLVFCLRVCLKVPDGLELELQTVVSCDVVAGN